MDQKLKTLLEWIGALGAIALACAALTLFVWVPLDYILEHLAALLQAHYK